LPAAFPSIFSNARINWLIPLKFSPADGELVVEGVYEVDVEVGVGAAFLVVEVLVRDDDVWVLVLTIWGVLEELV